uniref:Uncharacterized protein n=1 Tax=Arundo donax TaxID=35708 RepID=A0A0A9B2Q4_ARUDO
MLLYKNSNSVGQRKSNSKICRTGYSNQRYAFKNDLMAVYITLD